jgi:hypothetical protein
VVPFSGPYASGVGGYIDNYPWQADFHGSIDVAEWSVRRVYEWEPLPIGGNMGATDARLTGYQYEWAADVLFDFRRPADSWAGWRMKGLIKMAMVFWFGENSYVRDFLAASAGAIYPFLWCPDAVLIDGLTNSNAAAKKITRVPCHGITRSHVFLCPTEGTPNDANTISGAYNQWYGGR